MRPSKNPKFGLFPESGNTADRNRLDTVDTKFPVDHDLKVMTASYAAR